MLCIVHNVEQPHNVIVYYQLNGDNSVLLSCHGNDQFDSSRALRHTGLSPSRVEQEGVSQVALVHSTYIVAYLENDQSQLVGKREEWSLFFHL